MPAVCRGDSVDSDVTHCSTPMRDQRSTNVFVNGTGISRQGDNNTSHLLPGAPCPSHAAPIATGSTTVCPCTITNFAPSFLAVTATKSMSSFGT